MRKASAISISLILLCFVIGCDKAGSPVTASDQPTEQTGLAASEVQNLEGEEIYRAFAFARGPVVDLFPELFGDINYETVSTMSADEASEYADRIEGLSKQEISNAWENRDEMSPEELNNTVGSLVSKVIDQIRSDHPGYFEGLERKMKSGDHLQVQEALTSMAEVTVPAMAEVLGVSEDRIRGLQLPSPQGKCVDTVAVGLVAVAAIAAAAIAVAVESVVTKTHVVDPTADEAQTKLRQEITVDRIVDRLAHT